MLQSEGCRMEGRPPRAAAIGKWLAVQRAVVHAFAAQRSASLCQMNADLVGAAGLQAALDQGVIAELLDDAHMRHGALSLAWLGGAPATSITAVIDKKRFDASGLRPPAHDRQITALDAMRAKLLAEIALRGARACKHHQAARVLVEPMHGPDRPRLAGAALGQQSRQQISQRRGQEAARAATKFCGLLRMARGGHTRRLLDDDEVCVRIGYNGLAWLHGGLAETVKPSLRHDWAYPFS